MCIVAAVVGGAVVSGAAGAYGAKKAAKIQARAADNATQLEREMFERQIELSEPWRKAGEQALNKLTPMAMNYTPFGMNQFRQDPGYNFRMSEGMKALERSAAARGGLLSGGTVKGIQQYGQNLASDEYQNAFNRYQTERAARLAPLQSLAGVGQTTAQQLGQAGQQMATNVGNNMTSAAAARASGYMGASNALTGALNTGLNYYQNQQYLDRLPMQTHGVAAPPAPPPLLARPGLND